MEKTDEMCSLQGNNPGVDVIQVKLEDLHAFKNHMMPLLEFSRHIFHSLSERQSVVQKESVFINMIQMEMQQMLIID